MYSKSTIKQNERNQILSKEKEFMAIVEMINNEIIAWNGFPGSYKIKVVNSVETEGFSGHAISSEIVGFLVLFTLSKIHKTSKAHFGFFLKYNPPPQNEISVSFISGGFLNFFNVSFVIFGNLIYVKVVKCLFVGFSSLENCAP